MSAAPFTPEQIDRLLTSDTNPGYVLSDDLQFYFLQFGNTVTADSLTGLVKELADWMLFLNFPRTSEATMKKVLFANPMLARTGNALSEFVADAPTRHYVEDMEKHRRDYEWTMLCERREGKAEGKIDALQHFLTARFKKVPKRISDRISQIGDLIVLDSLTVTAATCQSLVEFEEALG